MAITASPMKEVLDCKCSDLSMHKGTLFGLQMGYECTCIIKEYLDERDSYQNNDSEFLFITKNGSQVCRTHITKKFSMVGKELGFKFNLVSRMIQWAFVRYWMNHLPMEEVQEGIGTRKIPRLLKYTRYG
jgi:site-specific recombinase XerC